MALDISWVICSKCGRKPPEITSFTLSDPILCGECKPEILLEQPEINAPARHKLGEALLKLTPIAVAYTTEKMMGAQKGEPVMMSLDHLEQACEAMRIIKLLVYGKSEVTVEAQDAV